LKRPDPVFPHIVPHFRFEGEFIRAEPYGFGHINDTYAAHFQTPDAHIRRYLMQRINHYVFRDPERLMHNIAAVTNHLRGRIAAAGGDPERETLNIIPTVEGKACHRTLEGYWWRAYVFIEGAQTYQIAESLDHVYSAGKAFGNFQRLLGDFPANELHETIPGFHHTKKRFEAFIEALERDVHSRAQFAKDEIEFVLRRGEETPVLVELLERGQLPKRVTHNDTKFNNVMIDDETGDGVCVIDLDTVMPGSSLYDFGDGVRSITNTAAEDEQDLSRVQFSLVKFKHFTKGFLDATRDFLTPSEADLLPFSARLMTFEVGLRFLTDYLNGDVYFKTHRQDHNLDRCRTQFRLVREMEERSDQMMRLVQRHRTPEDFGRS
jgi:Ser/Thr protein kinase RdoA (MazF antagonist)